jgi:hypothetical protein
MQGVDVLHLVAGVTLAFLFIRGIQLLTHHYAPGSGAAMAEDFLYGRP